MNLIPTPHQVKYQSCIPFVNSRLAQSPSGGIIDNCHRIKQILRLLNDAGWITSVDSKDVIHFSPNEWIGDIDDIDDDDDHSFGDQSRYVRVGQDMLTIVFNTNSNIVISPKDANVINLKIISSMINHILKTYGIKGRICICDNLPNDSNMLPTYSRLVEIMNASNWNAELKFNASKLVILSWDGSNDIDDIICEFDDINM